MASTELINLPTLCPPARFGIVEPGIYRSNQLHPINFPYIQQLKLKTVVLLTPYQPNKILSTFFKENNINVVHLSALTKSKSATKYSDSGSKKGAARYEVSEELVKEGLELILDMDNSPVMIECETGIFQTGTLVGCLRRLQNWNLTSILQEYRSFSSTDARFANEQLIELFDVDLVALPPEHKLPSWFVESRNMLEEEKHRILNKEPGSGSNGHKEKENTDTQETG